MDQLLLAVRSGERSEPPPMGVESADRDKFPDALGDYVRQ
jgi:hypothetical protein